MSLHSAAVLVLVLCLGQTVNTQQGSLLPPSIRAEPGLFVLQGHSATIVCSSTIEYDTFRLEKENKCIENKENTKPSVKEARFHLGPANKGTAGRYRCIYKIGHEWSERSEPLELQVISQNITEAPPDPGSTVTSDISWLKTDDIYILIAASVGFLLCLLLFLFCFHCYRQKKHRLLKSKSQQQSPQKRLCHVTNGLERTPDIVTDDRLPEDQKTETRIPVEGSLQEVTYAQLNHHALTQRTVRAVTPQSTDNMTESSTYASIIRH